VIATMATDPPIDLDRLSIDDVRGGALRDRPVTVLGLARTGVAVARFFADLGAAVTVYDGRSEAALADAVGQLEGRQIRLLAGPDVDPAIAWHGASLVVSSPSINPDYPTTEPRLRVSLQALVAARRRGDRHAPALVSEPDLFLRLCPAPTVGVTGTKGKTTTASLIAAVLATDPIHPVALGGNIGTPLIERLPELTPDYRVVIELSELQLPTLSRGTTVAVYTNVTSDHLDRHGSLEAYHQAKRRLAELVDRDGALVLNADDPVVAAYAGLGTAPVTLYHQSPPGAGEVGVDGEWIAGAGVARLALAGAASTSVATAEPSGRILPVSELAIPGEHNVSNALAAVATGLLFGVPPEAIRAAVASFEGVEHRLEQVAVIDGVRFVNDSQGTQPDAVAAALRAFNPPIVLIAGGRDKGVDVSALGPLVAERAVAAILIGESGPALERLFHGAGLGRTERAATLEEAVRRADLIARDELAAGRPGPATVLLSPAAASFDMFEDYAARGRAFKTEVDRLAAERHERTAERRTP
jgi:UDP-N-acetylmuramoylalanine--D-glutamate ligase